MVATPRCGVGARVPAGGMSAPVAIIITCCVSRQTLRRWYAARTAQRAVPTFTNLRYGMGSTPIIPKWHCRCKKSCVDEAATIGLLKNAFSEKEWEYLNAHPQFQQSIKERHSSQADYEHLVEVGESLLRQRRELKTE
jgi:hypothetical protein